jgi:hypothetical protein
MVILCICWIPCNGLSIHGNEYHTIPYRPRVCSHGVAHRVTYKRIWPPHPSDLNPCNFCLLDMSKKKVYSNNPHAEDDLKESIQYFTVH